MAANVKMRTLHAARPGRAARWLVWHGSTTRTVMLTLMMICRGDALAHVDTDTHEHPCGCDRSRKAPRWNRQLEHRIGVGKSDSAGQSKLASWSIPSSLKKKDQLGS